MPIQLFLLNDYFLVLLSDLDFYFMFNEKKKFMRKVTIDRWGI